MVTLKTPHNVNIVYGLILPVVRRSERRRMTIKQCGGSMKKFLWVIVAILLVATFSDHPRLKPYKDQLYGLFAETAGNASQVHGEQVLRTIDARFASFSAELGQKQQAELKRITSSRAELITFYQAYCKEKQFNPLFFGETQNRICSTIKEFEHGLR